MLTVLGTSQQRMRNMLMNRIGKVPYSFSDSPTKRRKEEYDLQSNIRKIRRLSTSAQKSNSLTGAEVVQLEQQWTDAILELLCYGNLNVLKSFQYHLQMEEREEFLMKQGMHLQLDEL
jgi:hypothetical protein